MKKILAASLILSSISTYATCPEFAPHYVACESTDQLIIESVKVRNRDAFHHFSLIGKSGSRRINLVTDGEPRDITVQTQDGSSSNYIEVAVCAENKLLLTRTNEENDTREETAFAPTPGGLAIHHYVNGEMASVTTCHTPSL